MLGILRGEGEGGRKGETAINPRVPNLCRSCVYIELQSWNQRSMLDIRIFTSKVLLFSCQVWSEKQKERDLCWTTLDKLHPKQFLRGCRAILLFWEWNRVKIVTVNSVQRCACVWICFESDVILKGKIVRGRLNFYFIWQFWSVLEEVLILLKELNKE